MDQNAKTYRNVMLRLSKKNVLHSDNPELGLVAGESYEYTKEGILEVLNKWSETKKIEFFMIEHNPGEENDHFHVVIKFDNRSLCSFKTLKRKFAYGDISNCRYGVKACVQYLVHLNNPEKRNYDWSEVVTNSPAKLEVYKQPTKSAMNDKLKATIDLILSGDLKRYEIDRIDPEIYIRYKRRIEAAFEYRKEILISDPDRDIEIIVLQGKAGYGKSTFCKAFAKSTSRSIRFSSTSNDPWCMYNGEQVFVYDDLNYEKIKIEDMIS